MDNEIENLGKSLKLIDEEDSGIEMPTGLWHGDTELEGFCLVGRLLSQKSVNFDAMRSILLTAFNPIRGMEAKLIEDNRILFIFSHHIDRKRVMENTPWAYDKNLLLLNMVGETKNPAHVELNWSDFHVRVHDLPINRMNKDVAVFIGNQLGRFRDIDMDKSEGLWVLTKTDGYRGSFGHSIDTSGGDCGAVSPEPMIALSWNCQGIEAPWTVQALKESGISVEANGKSGGLALLWNRSFQVCIQSYSRRHIDASISSDEIEQTWRFTGIFGDPEATKRRHTWDLLSILGRQSVRPWLCIGDFNEILDNSEKVRGSTRPLHAAFRQTLIKHLMDFSGRRVEDLDEIQNIISDHFQQVFTTDSPSNAELERGTEFVSMKVDAGMNEILLQPYTEEEIQQALFQMAPLKSPGPDERQGHIKGISICKQATSISHLLFADDTQIYCQATPQSILCIEVLPQLLGLRYEEQLDKYLGLPSVVGRSRKSVFDYIRDRVWQRIQGWNERNLSQTGKMRGWRLRISSIESFQFGFIGEATVATCYQHFQPYFPSYEARYYPTSSPLEAKLGSRPSLTWRSILSTREIIQAGVHYRISSGTSVKIWKDPWISRPSTFKPLSPPPHGLEEAVVAALIDPQTKDWDQYIIDAIFCQEDRDLILQIPVGRVHQTDLLCWHYTANGAFTVRSAYLLALKLHNPASSSQSPNSELSGFWKIIWKANVPPKVRLFAWKLANKALPSGTALENRMKIPQPPCYFCGASENFAHVFVQCHIARQAWALSNLPWDIISRWKDDPLHWFRGVGNHLQPMDFDLFLVMCWFLWWSRN
ncbi:UNVERIFIED_CONTAM: hypothetical protein Slati_2695300 [Sesamum latifolium]|uniref:Reverse transcriptase zinc-binding domain-containing protein n=1 Tax=Sesamum latifolium TaxID=2727402 RepID=A0AAW2VXJ4_9LAMI